MIRSRSTRIAAGILSLALVAAACGGDDAADAPAEEPAEEPAGEPAEEPAAEVAMADVCPSPIVIQTDWFPEAEHGALYNLIGAGYTVDTGMGTVRGPLSLDGVDYGIDVEVRAGGPFLGQGSTVATTVYADDSITMGYANTEGQIFSYETAPMYSVVAPLEINPQMVMWDPVTYPEIETLAGLREAGVTIQVFGGGVFAPYFVGAGIWSEDQVDPSYNGSPARFISEGGAIAQQGFASAEPYDYLNTFSDWGKEVRFQTLHDAGFEVYAATLAVRPDRLEELRPCLELFVPVVQQSVVSYAAAPTTANEVIVDAVTQFDSFWVQSMEITEWSVGQQLDLGLIGNGPDSTVGNMEADRIQGIIDAFTAAGLEVPEGLTPEDMFTNEFIDESIGF